MNLKEIRTDSGHNVQVTMHAAGFKMNLNKLASYAFKLVQEPIVVVQFLCHGRIYELIYRCLIRRFDLRSRQFYLVVYTKTCYPMLHHNATPVILIIVQFISVHWSRKKAFQIILIKTTDQSSAWSFGPFLS